MDTMPTGDSESSSLPMASSLSSGWTVRVWMCSSLKYAHTGASDTTTGVNPSFIRAFAITYVPVGPSVSGAPPTSNPVSRATFPSGHDKIWRAARAQKSTGSSRASFVMPRAEWRSNIPSIDSITCLRPR